LLTIKDDCFTGKFPTISDLTEYQREVREIVKIQIHLFTYVQEKLDEIRGSNFQTEIAESEPELEETQRFRPEPSQKTRDLGDSMTSPVPRPAVQPRHAKYDDLPL